MPANARLCDRLDGAHFAGPQWVHADADALADWRDEKGLQITGFRKAADGIRTHDLLHGKQNMRSRASQKSHGKERIPSYSSSAMLSSFYREITGLSGLKPDWGSEGGLQTPACRPMRVRVASRRDASLRESASAVSK